MEPLTEAEIRQSFVNCSRGESKRIGLPRDFARSAWDEMDALAWRDPTAPLRGLIVTRRDDVPTGVVLRYPNSGVRPQRANMCSLCLTTHSPGGVVAMVAPRAGQSGRDGNSVGTYICSDLDCSAYVRGKVPPGAREIARETLSSEEKSARYLKNLLSFVEKVVSVPVA